MKRIRDAFYIEAFYDAFMCVLQKENLERDTRRYIILICRRGKVTCIIRVFILNVIRQLFRLFCVKLGARQWPHLQTSHFVHRRILYLEIRTDGRDNTSMKSRSFLPRNFHQLNGQVFCIPVQNRTILCIGLYQYDIDHEQKNS